MKRILKLTLICALMLTAACRSEKPGTFTITGEVDNVKDSCMIILVKSAVGSASAEMIAIDTLVDGRFEFTAVAEDSASYHLVTPHVGVFSSMYVDIYAEPGAKIKVMGDGYLIRDWRVESKVRNQKIHQSYLDLVAPMFHQMQEMELEYRRMGKPLEYLDASRHLDKEVSDTRLDWLKKQRKVSEPWLDLMKKEASYASHMKNDKRLKELTAIWENVDPSIMKTKRGQDISATLYPEGTPLNVDDVLPMDVRMYDIDGNEHTFNDFKGKTMLIYFGSYGCAPCVIAKKEMNEIARQDRSIEIIGLNLDAEKSWKINGRKNPVEWHDFSDLKRQYGFITRFKTIGIPTFVIVSKEGKILDVWAGYRDGIIKERLEKADL